MPLSTQGKQTIVGQLGNSVNVCLHYFQQADVGAKLCRGYPGPGRGYSMWCKSISEVKEAVLTQSGFVLLR